MEVAGCFIRRVDTGSMEWISLDYGPIHALVF